MVIETPTRCNALQNKTAARKYFELVLLTSYLVGTRLCEIYGALTFEVTLPEKVMDTFTTARFATSAKSRLWI